MRLLRADGDELKLENVQEDMAKYAILSHRWLADEEEVTFNDVQDGRDVRSKQGLKKLEYCRQQALRDGLQYIWMDTCCIDKSSSQELTESINSMYRWYQRAECCYVYLHDMPGPRPADAVPDQPTHDDEGDAIALPCKALVICRDFAAPTIDHPARAAPIHTDHIISGNAYDPAQAESEVGRRPPDALRHWDREAFGKCEWFTRGWTLQEMLASRRVKFYNRSWKFIAELSDISRDVSSITGIHPEALTRERHVRSYSIAQRMSWAAGRLTTRLEDRAYSLLGLLDVNIGVIYGEGDRAFQRLQDELLRTTSDQSIFAFQGLIGSKSRNNLLANLLIASRNVATSY